MSTAEQRIASVEAENAALRSDNAALRAQIQELVAQVQDVQARLAQATKDSHTSSKPPSSDPLGRKRPRSQRRKSGKKPGGQLGHTGETLHLVAAPDEVVEHRPVVCVSCQTPLDETASVVLYERRQVRELPPVRLVVREHRALHVRCPACAQVSVGSFPPEAPSRAQYGPRLRALAVYLLEQQLIPYARVRELFVDLLAAPVSLGTLTRWVRQGAQTLQLGFALQLGTVRYLGTFLPDPLAIPSEVIAYVAAQLGITTLTALPAYTARKMTAHAHTWEIRRAYGYRAFSEAEADLRAYLTARAWATTDGSSALFARATAWLFERKTLLPKRPPWRMRAGVAPTSTTIVVDVGGALQH
jgi:hypothetical protein